MVKTKTLLLLTLFFAVFISFSQERSKDSLQLVELSKLINNYKSEIHLKKAYSFFKSQNLDSSLFYAMKQLNQKNESDDVINISHYIRGMCFYRKKIFSESKSELLQVNENFKFHYLAKLTLGGIALEQREFDKARSYFLNLLKLPEKEYLYINKSAIFNNIGLSYFHQEDFKKAEPYYIQSIKIQEEERDTIKLIGSYGNMASFYYNQYKDNLAIPYFEKAYQLAKKNEDFDLKRRTTKNMAVVEENRKNYKKALSYRKEYEQWKDSLNDQNKIWEVAQVEKEFAVKEKQKEVNFLAIQNRLKTAERNSFLYAAIILLALLLTSIYFYREKVKKNKIIASQKEDLDALNATKDKLFSIVSHDLRSSVNALKISNSTLHDNLASKNMEALDGLLQKNSAIVNGAYGLLDNLLNWAILQTDQGYFDITSLRLQFIVEHVTYNYKPLLFEKELSLENLVAKKDLAYADQESLKIVLRNLLDNAIKFSNPQGSIKIYTRNESNTYCDLIIEDTGLGMNETTRLDLLKDTALLHKKEHEDIIGTGLGLQLCKSLIKKNNGKFNIESELGKGTKMIVSLPKTARDE